MALTRREQNAGAVISIFAIALLLIYLSFGFIPLESEVVLLAAIGTAFLGAIALCLLVLRTYRKRRDPEMIDYLNAGVQRYVLAILMVIYGIDKLLGNFFDYQLFALDSKLTEVSEFQLAWFFYGKSRWQELFTGIMEFVPGVFLFYRRSYFIAALVLLPVTAQVFLLNLFFKIGGITFPASAILLACNLYLIYGQREHIMRFFRSLQLRAAGGAGSGAKRVIRVLRTGGIVLAVLVVGLKLRPVVFKSAYQRKYAQLVGAYTLKAMTRNGQAYDPAGDRLYYKDLYIEKQARWNILRAFDDRTEAFILRLDTRNDSIGLYLNEGGIGDGPDIIDSATALTGVYRLDGSELRIRGTQMADTLELVYERQARLSPKSWFW